MARFLVATLPINGHFTAGMVIAQELVRRGHEVGWYTGHRFRSKVEAAGIRFFGIKASIDFDDRDTNSFFNDRKGRRGFGELKFMIKHILTEAAPGQVTDLEQIYREFAVDVLVADPLLYGGGWQHERGGPVWAAFGHLPLTYTSCDTAPFGLALLPDASWRGRLRNRLLVWLGMKTTMRDVVSYIDQARVRVGLPPQNQDPGAIAMSPYLYLQGTAPEFEYPRSDLPPQVHFVGPFLPPPLPPAQVSLPAWWSDLWQSGLPVVHVTQGTMETDPGELILPTIEALAGEKVLLIVTTGGKPVESLNLPALPGNVRVETFIPHSCLLPHVNVMVTNGGYNGVQMALANGVPLLVNGHVDDKPEVGRRVEWSGVGINLRRFRPDPAQIRRAVWQLLDDPQYRAKARQMQAVFAGYEAASLSAQLLEQLANKVSVARLP